MMQELHRFCTLCAMAFPPCLGLSASLHIVVSRERKLESSHLERSLELAAAIRIRYQCWHWWAICRWMYGIRQTREAGFVQTRGRREN